MKPHPRIRKTIKWGGAAVTVLLVVVWIGSGWAGVMCMAAQQRGLLLMRGQLVLMWSDTWIPVADRLAWGVERYELRWWFAWHPDQIGWTLALPVWLFVIASLTFTTIAWRLDTIAHRRARTHCPKCNYERAGIAVGAVCPECGAIPVGG